MTEAEARAGFIFNAESAGGMTVDSEGRPVWHALTFDETESLVSDYANWTLGRRSALDPMERAAMLSRWHAGRKLAVIAMVDARGRPQN